MSELSDAIDALIAAGASAEIIGATVKAVEAGRSAKVEAQKARKRFLAAERQSRYRDARNADNASPGVTTTEVRNAGDALHGVTVRDNALQASPSVTPIDASRAHVANPLEELVDRKTPPSEGQKVSADADAAPSPQPTAKPSRRKTATAFPEGWEFGERERLDALRISLNRWPETRMVSTFDRFRDHHLQRGSMMASWAAAWRTWCRNDIRFEAERLARAGPVNGHGRPERRNLSFAALELENHERSRFEQQHDSSSDVAGPVETGGRSSPRSEDGGGSILSLAAYGRHS